LGPSLSRKFLLGGSLAAIILLAALAHVGIWAAILALTAAAYASEVLAHSTDGISLGGAYYDLPAATAILKELYDGQLVENEVYKENPAYAMIQKNTKFFGKSRPLPLAYGVQSATSNFTNAQQNQAPIQYAEFLMTRKRLYALATIDNETMEATEHDVARSSMPSPRTWTRRSRPRTC
jgi:hypothetical protein